MRVPNLASHVLSRAARQLRRDWQQRHGVEPLLLETFVAQGQRGTSLKAANFVRLGVTAGRGRQDRRKRRAAGRKTVLVYEWDSGWRKELGVEWVDPAPRLKPGEGLDSEGWARQEFGGAMLGDKRLTKRLVHSAQLLAQQPRASIARSALGKGRNASVDGYYRLIEKPKESAVKVKRACWLRIGRGRSSACGASRRCCACRTAAICATRGGRGARGWR